MKNYDLGLYIICQYLKQLNRAILLSYLFTYFDVNLDGRPRQGFHQVV